MNKIFFIVQQLSQPRCIKRIEDVALSGFNYEVYGFNNGLYDENITESRINISKVRFIEKKSSKINKIIEYYKLVKYVISISKKNDLIYCFGFELGAICSFLNYKCKFIYEEADISAIRFSNYLIRKTLIGLDKWIVKRANLVIFTSKGFIKCFYKKTHNISKKIIFIENKLHPYFFSIDRKLPRQIKIENITFGFIGLIRYPNTIIRFAKVIADYFPQHKFYFFGDIDGDLIDMKEWSNYANIKFWGKFKNPLDLERVYNQIDINVACYDVNNMNVRVAEPNKLYESIFFQKPLVVSSNTFLSERIKEYNSGFSIDASNNGSIIDFIKKIDSEDIESILNCISLIPKNELISNKEEFINRLSNLCK